MLFPITLLIGKIFCWLRVRIQILYKSNNNNNNKVYYLNNRSYHRQSLLVTETFVNLFKLSCWSLMSLLSILCMDGIADFKYLCPEILQILKKSLFLVLISCSLECLTLNLNIARVCKMWEGAFPRVKCQTQSTLSLVSWVSLAYSSPVCRSRHLFSLPGALAQPLGGRMLYFVNFIFLDSPEIPVPARVSLILQDVNPESWIMMNGWHSLLNNPTAT